MQFAERFEPLESLDRRHGLPDELRRDRRLLPRHHRAEAGGAGAPRRARRRSARRTTASRSSWASSRTSCGTRSRRSGTRSTSSATPTPASEQFRARPRDRLAAGRPHDAARRRPPGREADRDGEAAACTSRCWTSRSGGERRRGPPRALREPLGRAGVPRAPQPGLGGWRPDPDRAGRRATSCTTPRSSPTAGGSLGRGRDATAARPIIRVRDDGAGVAPDDLRKLFVPFVQSETTLAPEPGRPRPWARARARHRGAARRHGRRAQRRAGEGRRVRRDAARRGRVPAQRGTGALPRRRPGARRASSSSRTARTPPTRCATCSRVIGGHEVHVASDGESGVEAPASSRRDVILCDVGLPVIDGYEVARRIRADGAARDARLVAFSGYASSEDVERALRAGFDYHLAKPPDVERLLRLVAEAPVSGAVARPPRGHRDGTPRGRRAARRDPRAGGSPARRGSRRCPRRHPVPAGPRRLALRVRGGAHGGRGLSRASTATGGSTASSGTSSSGSARSCERDGGTPANVRALADVIERWVTGHVLEADRRLAEFIRARQDVAVA